MRLLFDRLTDCLTVLAVGSTLSLSAAHADTQEVRSSPERDDFERQIQNLVAQAEADLTAAGATDVQQRYLACHVWGDRPMGTASFGDLFPELADYREQNGFESEALFEDVYAMGEDRGLTTDDVNRMARDYVSFDVNFETCPAQLIPNYESIRRRADRAEMCAGYLRRSFGWMDDAPGISFCPFASLLDPIPDYVAEYNAAITAAAAERFNGLSVSQGRQIAEVTAAGQISESPEHCGTGTFTFRITASEEFASGIIDIDQAYIVKRSTEAADDGSKWTVIFPDGVQSRTAFCAAHGLNYPEEAEQGQVYNPIERVNEIIAEHVAERQ